jgi:putative hydrolase of the HAD superfamily
MDNTLFDFVAAKRHACGRIAHFLGRDDGEALLSYFLHSKYGFESHENVRDYLVDRSLYSDDLFVQCCTIYETEKVRVLEPYPRALETLETLRKRGFTMAVVTDAKNRNALTRLTRVNLIQFFDHVISYDMTGAKKPAPDAFLLALKKLGTHPEETLFVGDSLRRDIAPARQLGMVTAYAAYGDRIIQNIETYQPDFILESIDQLVDIVERRTGKPVNSK